MIYPDSFEQKLGFDQIRSKLKSYCLSQAGEEWVDRMRFSAEYNFIKALLLQNLEFRMILEKGESFPDKHFFDPAEWLRKVSLEDNWLEADEFIHMAYSLETIVACRAYLAKFPEVYPELYKLAA